MTLRLPRLPPQQPPWNEMQLWWQRVVEAIEAQESAQDIAIGLIQDAQDAADAANAAAAAADAAAAAANAAADDTAAATALQNSWVTGATITATDVGANVTISITAHTRNYADGTSVSVNSGSLTGRAYSTTYFIYYDQASRAGGAVTYASTTTSSTAAQINDRHFVGEVTTPAAAGAPETGDYPFPPGQYPF